MRCPGGVLERSAYKKAEVTKTMTSLLILPALLVKVLLCLSHAGRKYKSSMLFSFFSDRYADFKVK